MSNERDKIKEPYRPESTPTPPQVIDPSRKEEERDASGKDKDVRNQTETPDQEKEESKKQLGDPTEIDDETTI